MQNFSEQQKEFLRNLFTELTTTINEKTAEIRSEITEQINELKNETLLTLKKFEEDIKKLQTENKKLRQDIIYLERKARKNNLVIFGLNSEDDLLTSVLNIFNQIGTKIEARDLNNVYRLKSRTNTNPVVAEFISFQQKLSVLKNAYKLKGKSIYISKDQCKEDREKNKTLINYQKQARAKGESAYIRGEKIYIEDKPYTIQQLDSLLAEDEEDVGNNKEKTDKAPTTPNYITLQGNLNKEPEREDYSSKKPEKPVQKVKDPKELDISTDRVTRSNMGPKKK